MRKIILCALALLCTATTYAKRPDTSSDKTPSTWDMDRLKQTPKYRFGSQENRVVEVYYEGLDYNGKSKEVFAYYSNPDILAGRPSNPDKRYPTVVCAHGGGGCAFSEWVIKWARRGYAAISMDQRGYGAGGARGGEPLSNGFKENEKLQTPFFTSFKEQTNDWFYQAVGDVVLAHSLVLSFPEVDKERTAITGISWGGIITTLVSGLDDRFKVAVPVYGCGFLYETGSMAPQILRSGKATQERWNKLYDPSLFVCNSKIPMLFVNGTNDTHFYMDQWQKTTDLAQGDVERSVRYQMKHGHNQGWSPAEISNFIGYHLGVEGCYATPQFKELKLSDGTISCKVSNLQESAKAYLLSTDTGAVSHKATWVKSEANIRKNGMIDAKVTGQNKQMVLTVEYEDGSNYSSSVIFR